MAERNLEFFSFDDCVKTISMAKIFRSLWGASKADWGKLFTTLKKEGFCGIEASLSDINYPETDEFFSLLNQNGFSWICGIYTTWSDYIEPEPEHKSISDQLLQFESQLKAVDSLRIKPIHVNSHCIKESY